MRNHQLLEKTIETMTFSSLSMLWVILDEVKFENKTKKSYFISNRPKIGTK